VAPLSHWRYWCKANLPAAGGKRKTPNEKADIDRWIRDWAVVQREASA
jgi:hypothetical protein